MNRLPASFVSEPTDLVEDEVKAPMFPEPPFQRKGSKHSRPSVFAEMKEVFYSLGDEGSDDDMILHEDPIEHVMAIGRLLENEYVFIRRSGGKFCFAMIKSVYPKPDGVMMELYVSEAGNKKTIPMSEWGRFIRPKKAHVSYSPPPVVETLTKGKSVRSTLHETSAYKGKDESYRPRNRRASLPVMQDLDGQPNTQASNPVRPMNENKTLKALNRRASCPETVRYEDYERVKCDKKGRRNSVIETKLDYSGRSGSSSKSDVNQYAEGAMEEFLSIDSYLKMDEVENSHGFHDSLSSEFAVVMDDVKSSSNAQEALKNSSSKRVVKSKSTTDLKHLNDDRIGMKSIRSSNCISSFPNNSGIERCLEVRVHTSCFQSNLRSSRHSSLQSSVNTGALGMSNHFDHDKKSLRVSFQNMDVPTAAYHEEPQHYSKPDLSEDRSSPTLVAKFFMSEAKISLPKQHLSTPFNERRSYTIPYQQLPSSPKERRSLSDSQLKHAGRGNNRRASVGSELTANQRFNESQLLSAFARIGRPPFETSKKG